MSHNRNWIIRLLKKDILPDRYVQLGGTLAGIIALPVSWAALQSSMHQEEVAAAAFRLTAPAIIQMEDQKWEIRAADGEDVKLLGGVVRSYIPVKAESLAVEARPLEIEADNRAGILLLARSLVETQRFISARVNRNNQGYVMRQPFEVKIIYAINGAVRVDRFLLSIKVSVVGSGSSSRVRAVDAQMYNVNTAGAEADNVVNSAFQGFVDELMQNPEHAAELQPIAVHVSQPLSPVQVDVASGAQGAAK